MAKRHRNKWVTRTVRDGRVLIYGKQYQPDEMHREYRGELDGLRMHFGLYPNWGRGGEGEEFLAFVYLWGTEAQHLHPDDETCEEPHLIDGGYPWMFWYQEGKKNG